MAFLPQVAVPHLSPELVGQQDLHVDVLPYLLFQQVQPLQHRADGVRLHVPHVLRLHYRLALTLTSGLPEVGQRTAAFVRARSLRSRSECKGTLCLNS